MTDSYGGFTMEGYPVSTYSGSPAYVPYQYTYGYPNMSSPMLTPQANSAAALDSSKINDEESVRDMGAFMSWMKQMSPWLYPYANKKESSGGGGGGGGGLMSMMGGGGGMGGMGGMMGI